MVGCQLNFRVLWSSMSLERIIVPLKLEWLCQFNTKSHVWRKLLVRSDCNHQVSLNFLKIFFVNFGHAFFWSKSIFISKAPTSSGKNNFEIGFAVFYYMTSNILSQIFKILIQTFLLYVIYFQIKFSFPSTKNTLMAKSERQLSREAAKC